MARSRAGLGRKRGLASSCAFRRCGSFFNCFLWRGSDCFAANIKLPHVAVFNQRLIRTFDSHRLPGTEQRLVEPVVAGGRQVEVY